MHSTASTPIAASAARLGTWAGHVATANGAYTTQHSASAVPITVTEGTPVR